MNSDGWKTWSVLFKHMVNIIKYVEGRRTSSIHDSYQLQKFFVMTLKKSRFQAKISNHFLTLAFQKGVKMQFWLCGFLVRWWLSIQRWWSFLWWKKCKYFLSENVRLRQLLPWVCQLALQESFDWITKVSSSSSHVHPQFHPQHAKHILGYTMSLPKFSQISQGVNIVTLLSSLYFSSELHQGQMKPI